MTPPLSDREIQDPGLFRLFVESVEDHALVLLNPDGTVASWNEGAERIEGYAAHEIVGRPFATFFCPEDVARGLPDEILRGAAKQGHFAAEGWRLRKDGQRYWASATLTALWGESRALRGFARIVRDITGRHSLEATLRESEERFRTMANGAPVMLWMAGVDSLCTFFNEGWLRFTGRSMEQELGSAWAEGVHPEDFQRCMDTYLAAFVARQRFAMEYRLRRADGAYRWLYDQGAPRFAPDGRFAGYIGSCVDVSDRREAEEALRLLNEQLRERTVDLAATVQERNVLLREVHHRVKNNLQLVSSLLSLQARKLVDPCSREVCEDCEGRVQAIALIHEALYQSGDLSRIPFSDYARTLAANVLHATGASAAITLKVDVQDVQMPVDKAIPCGLILNELITNAVKHAFPGGRPGKVHVQFGGTETDRLALAVSDDGVGLPPQLDPQKTGSLGFQLLKTLAHQLDAEVEIRREAGTTFRFTFKGGYHAAQVS